MFVVKRGEVWWVNFEPSIGGEIQKTRPAVIVSNNAFNKVSNRVQVVPVTSNITNLYPCEAYITINNETRKAMADQIATISKLRLIKKIGIVSGEDMDGIEKVIQIQLGIGY